MMSRRWIAVFATAVFALTSCSAFGQGKGHGKGHDKDKHDDDDSNEHVVVSSYDRDSIRAWYHEHESGLPPGLAKRDRLPPGLEKQLRERGTLPPGLQKRVQPLPFELERQLHLLPTGYRRVVIGGNVILMKENTAAIYDTIRGAIP